MVGGARPTRIVRGTFVVVVLSTVLLAAVVSADSIESPDTVGSVGRDVSMALDGSGYPVIAYRDSGGSGALKVLHCNDPDCAPGGDSIQSPDTGSTIGLHTSIQLDAVGNPVISYRDATNAGNEELKILHCNDPNCAPGGDSIQSPDVGGLLGIHTSLELDAAGNPVVSYFDFSNSMLRVLHCNDPDCAPGGDSIESPLSPATGGTWSSLELDGNGFPVISLRASTSKLTIIHCNDANCAGADESIEFPDPTPLTITGEHSSLELDASGYPVVSYHDDTNGDLKVIHCNDPDCAGGDESITTPDTAGDVGEFTSLALDATGNPVIAYHDVTNGDVKLLRCDDPNCAGGNDPSASRDGADDVGSYASLVLDSSSFPVIAYFDATNSDLKVLHCNDVECLQAVYVDPTAGAGTQDGTTWANAYLDLKVALQAAMPGDLIFVAEGTYRPDTSDRTLSFQLPASVTIIGGYEAGGGAGPDNTLYPTVLSGDLDGDDNGTIATGDLTRDDNSYRVVNAGPSVLAARLMHLTISDGNANGAVGDDFGAGVHLSGDVALEYVTIEHNSASKGAGARAIGTTGTTLRDVTFVENVADTFGGGLLIGPGADIVVINSRFKNNEAGTHGGGISIDGANPFITNTRIADNDAGGTGGGIRATNGANLTIVNSLITGNTANGGAGINNDASTATIITTTIADNVAVVGGGGVRNAATATSIITSTIVYPNAAPTDPALSGSGFTVSYSDIQGGAAGTANVDTPPLFAGTYRLLPISPMIDEADGNIIPADVYDVDNDGDLAEATPDLGLDKRLRNQADMGAFEYDPPDGLTVLSSPCAIYDSTTAIGSGLSGSFSAGETRTVKVTGFVPSGQGVAFGQCVPANASSVVYTISALDPQAPGNLRLSESGVVPNGGVVNYVSNGLNNANTVTVPLDEAGAADITANAGATDVRLVVAAYYSDGGVLDYIPLTPCAVADSRSATGGYLGPFAAGAAFPDIDVVDTFSSDQGGGNTNCGVPTGADGVVVNVVAIKPVAGYGGTGFLTAGTGGTSPMEPTTPFTDIPLNNAASTIVPLDGGETIAIDVGAIAGSPSAHIRVVVLGYVEPSVGDTYTPVNPCAAFDTRSGLGAGGGFLGERLDGTATTYSVLGSIDPAQGGAGGDCGVPIGASGVLINLVGIGANAAGNFQAYATGTTPTGGVLNWSLLSPPMNNSNAIVVPVSAAGEIDIFTNAPANAGAPTVHARGIILGYYS